jgi:hypothetical protein
VSDVLSLADHKKGNWLSGPCKCFKCKHTWIGVMPVGTTIIACPNCGCDGVRTGNVVEKGKHWECDCGCDVFRIVEKYGPYCVECGKDAVGWFK